MLDKRLFVAALAVVAPLLTGVTCGIGEEDVEERTITAELQGEQVVPPVETEATGRATARLFGNLLRLQGTFSGLESPVLPAEEGSIVFRRGAVGEADGETILTIEPASLDGRTGTFVNDVSLDDALVDVFLEGLTYVEIRTVDHPDGELRAQMK